MSDREKFMESARRSFRAAADRQERQEQRVEKRRALDDLKTSALNALERRGYAVRGKTTSQIREVLRRKPTLPLLQRPE